MSSLWNGRHQIIQYAKIAFNVDFLVSRFSTINPHTIWIHQKTDWGLQSEQGLSYRPENILLL